MKKRMNGAQIVVEVLKKQGVEYIFGYPGGACMPIFDALVDAPELKIILVPGCIPKGGTKNIFSSQLGHKN